MAMSTSERVDSLENALKELAYAGRKTEMSIDRLSEEMREFKAEMAAFKNEMSEFKDEMSEFKNEMLAFKDEMSEFKNEMLAFKDEMSEFKNEMLAFKDEMSEFKNEMSGFKDEMSGFKGEMSDFKGEMLSYKEENRREARRMNKQWGELANKWGTFTEDMVVPNFPRILEHYFGVGEEDLEGLLANPRKRHPSDRSRRKEFDLIAWTAGYVFWNETKASAKMRFLIEFVEDTTSLFEFFPELAGRRLVKIASALSMTDEEITYLTNHRCYAMALGDETMDLLNFDEVGGLD